MPFTSGSQGGAAHDNRSVLREKTGVELPAVTRFVFTFSKEEVKPNAKKEGPTATARRRSQLQTPLVGVSVGPCRSGL